MRSLLRKKKLLLVVGGAFAAMGLVFVLSVGMLLYLASSSVQTVANQVTEQIPTELPDSQQILEKGSEAMSGLGSFTNCLEKNGQQISTKPFKALASEGEGVDNLSGAIGFVRQVTQGFVDFGSNVWNITTNCFGA